MAIDSHIKNFIRMGRVSTTNPEKMTVKVVFEDKDNMVSDELPVLVQGSSRNRHYWLPDVGEQVCCLMLPNGHNAGICLGSYYSEADPPNANSQEVRRIDFGDGSYMQFDRATGNLNISCTGEIRINGKMIYLN